MTMPLLTTLALSLAALQWSKLVLSIIFVFAFGGICGSFINVIVYRLPLGQSIVRPPSACPKCSTKLSWRDNIPVFGWIVLRGRCRYCKAPISGEYPIVEFIVATLFTLTFFLWFADAQTLMSIGFDPTPWRPEWALGGLQRTWPIAILFAALFFSLVTITLIDAKTFHIPLVIPWMLAGFALIAHPVSALWMGSNGALRRSPHEWVIPVANWPWIGLALGAGVGLAISILLLRFGLLPRSFADYEAWEKANTPEQTDAPASGAETGGESDISPSAPGNALLRALFFSGPIIAGMFTGLAFGLRSGSVGAYVAIGAGVGMLVGLLLRRLVPDGERHESDPVWIHYPHARREMCKEALFLVIPIALAIAGYYIALTAVGPWTPNHQTGTILPSAGPPPLWLSALGGSLLGLIVGGGLVWAVRIGASLAFGKEAMGLGDVHLMAGVGAVLGWIDPTLAFFMAPFFGIAWVIGAQAMSMMNKDGSRAPTALPYGPHLAMATIFVVLAKPVLETGLSLIMSRTIDLP